MDHDFNSAAWADNHHKLSDGIADLFAAVGHAFAWLHVRQFDAPWQRKKRASRYSAFR